MEIMIVTILAALAFPRCWSLIAVIRKGKIPRVLWPSTSFRYSLCAC